MIDAIIWLLWDSMQEPNPLLHAFLIIPRVLVGGAILMLLTFAVSILIGIAWLLKE